MQTAAKAYLKTQVNTTSQGDILLLLYEGAIKFLGQAKEKIAARDYAQKGILISRALDILAELQSSLNAQKGGTLAENLQKLYFICSTKLLQANLKMDTAIIDEVMKILAGLRDAFRAANAEVTGQPAAAPQPQSAPYGVAPPSMAAKAEPKAPAKAPVSFPGFAKRAAPPAADVSGGEAASAAAARIVPPVAPPRVGAPAAAPRPGAAAGPAVAASPEPSQAPMPPPQVHSPMRRAFAAYATAREQKSAS
ncbi:flagellar export chaperone FliS [Desulfovibrio sulfodismutans]|uniref:Flagellar export chaperone FliS n=1 Tax=Desulfolutivibrio sulfodismutans TaxID=63561 RepID=A0A7K3NNG7_9BACT|nr:flagellar export chaperone FliS [Desulfolutivibrio sulfodismutans]NDY57373.1 flagellar export chaperone FliS [Desulfolutivibrio sulfodismutans]QLA12446.1 flagellar export chaperone FliS [Desulfolutivibrio sulfodismutans DSM 3696]